MFTTTFLRSALDTVKPVINPRSPMAIYQCFLFTSERNGERGKLVVKATNGGYHVTHAVHANDCKPQSVAVNAAQIASFVDAVGGASEFSCTYNPKNATIDLVSGKHAAKFRTYDAADFPIPPDFEATHEFELDSETFFNALKQGSIGRLESETGLPQECIVLHVVDGKFQIASNNSFRVAIANGMDVAGQVDGQFLFPPEPANYLKSLAFDGGTVKIKFNDRMIRVDLVVDGEIVTTLHSSRVDGKLPVPQSLPKNFGAILESNFADFQKAVNVVSVLMPNKDSKVLDVSVADGKMLIRPHAAPDSDTSVSEIDCEHNTPIAFSVNAQYVKDYLAVARDETIQIRTRGIGGVGEGREVNLYTPKHDSLTYFMAAIRSNDAGAK